MSYFHQGLAATDVFEAWADTAGRYRLKPRYVVQSGSSMGGFGTYDPQDATPMLAGLRNVPVLATANANGPLVNASWSGRTLLALAHPAKSQRLRPTPESFGHLGAGGQVGFADPVRHVAVGLVRDHLAEDWSVSNDFVEASPHGRIDVAWRIADI